MHRPKSLALREDAATKPLHERGQLLEATTTTDSGAIRRMIQIITPGWGSSGYYSAAVLEKAAEDKVIPAGTHMYLNHASATERSDRPERDVEKIAAVLVEDARWDGTRLFGEADLLGPNGELVSAIAPYIGVSISGSATDIVIGEAEGKRGPIIEGLAYVESVDFVTHAGRGGMVLLESARPSLVNALAVGHGIAEATANETREQLQQQLRDTFGGEKSWVWVRDFDDTTVWYEHETPDDAGTYGIAYEVADDGAVTISGSPTEVRATTTYVPVARPDSTTPTTTETHESKEDTVDITDEEYQRLQARAGRADELEAAEAARNRYGAAQKIANEAAKAADIEFDDLQVAGLIAQAPVIESGDNAGQLDADAFKTVAEAAATKVKERHTAPTGGGLRGFGESATPNGAVTESGAPARTAWGRPLAESQGA